MNDARPLIPLQGPALEDQMCHRVRCHSVGAGVFNHPSLAEGPHRLFTPSLVGCASTGNLANRGGDFCKTVTGATCASPHARLMRSGAIRCGWSRLVEECSVGTVSGGVFRLRRLLRVAPRRRSLRTAARLVCVSTCGRSRPWPDVVDEHRCVWRRAGRGGFPPLPLLITLRS